jgi:hypothetical protein
LAWLYEEEHSHASRYAQLGNQWRAVGKPGRFTRYADAHFAAIADEVRERLEVLPEQERQAATKLLEAAYFTYFDARGNLEQHLSPGALMETTRMLAQVRAFASPTERAEIDKLRERGIEVGSERETRISAVENGDGLVSLFGPKFEAEVNANAVAARQFYDECGAGLRSVDTEAVDPSGGDLSCTVMTLTFSSHETV